MLKHQIDFLSKFSFFILTNGLKNFGFFLKFKRGLWDFELSSPQQFSNTSIADSVSEAGYLRLCVSAKQDAETFDKFKANISYRRVLEHLTAYQGLLYLNQAKRSPHFRRDFRIASNQIDSFGGGEKYLYRDYGLASPTSLRYLKVTSDMLDLFGSLDRKVVSEIGCGYGGQSIALKVLCNVNDYNYFDLPEVLGLIETCISKVESPKNFQMIDGRDVPIVDSDVVISNYAFSELTRKMQDTYLRNVILRAKSGYITWNDLSFKVLDGYSIDELNDIIPNSQVLPDLPSLDAATRILVWGHNL